jgi:hypothetical protein
MNEAYEQMGDLDDIIIMLGTNDCKAVFKDSIRMVPDNFRKLLIMIRNHPVYMKFKPRIHVVSPPPAGRDEILIEKYHGGAQRIARLQPQFKRSPHRTGQFLSMSIQPSCQSGTNIPLMVSTLNRRAENYCRNC